MALTFQDVLNDAIKLSTRLKDHDTAADALVSQIQGVYQQVEAMKQYHEDIAQLNDLASERPRLALVAGIQQESKHIMDLQQENRELRIALEEQQNAIDLIMTKYRQHVSKLTQCQQFDLKLLKTIDSNTKVLESSTDRMNEMKFIMRKAISMDEEAMVKEEELLTRLWTENKGLRELLEISRRFGSCNSSLLSQGTEDKEVQTEAEDELSFSLSLSPNNPVYGSPNSMNNLNEAGVDNNRSSSSTPTKKEKDPVSPVPSNNSPCHLSDSSISPPSPQPIRMDPNANLKNPVEVLSS